jgi:nitrate/TMAO reductase-like tetraheme cytochrome c subunit
VRGRLYLPLLARDPLSLVGIAVATAAPILFLVFLLLELLGLLTNPYIGLLLFVAIPVAFILALLLIPIGMWRSARRMRRGGPAPEWPVVDLRKPRQRSVVTAVLALTAVNVVVISMAAYGGVHYMETAQFCGRVCHTTMEPQYAAYQAAPHARVACVECHVGSGMRALVESKIAGTRQLLEVITNTVTRPVPSPVRSMRPARETCEQCHWPEKFHGDTVRVIREYANDEKNTETATTLIMHVGGGSAALGIGTGIHWHMNLDNEIEYVATDPKRETIPYFAFATAPATCGSSSSPGPRPSSSPRANVGAWIAWTATIVPHIPSPRRRSAPSMRRSRRDGYRASCRSCDDRPSPL